MDIKAEKKPYNTGHYNTDAVLQRLDEINEFRDSIDTTMDDAVDELDKKKKELKDIQNKLEGSEFTDNLAELDAIHKDVILPYIKELLEYLPVKIGSYTRYYEDLSTIFYAYKGTGAYVSVRVTKHILGVFDVYTKNHETIDYELTLRPEIDADVILDLINKRFEYIKEQGKLQAAKGPDGFDDEAVYIARNVLEKYIDELRPYLPLEIDGFERDLGRDSVNYYGFGFDNMLDKKISILLMQDKEYRYTLNKITIALGYQRGSGGYTTKEIDYHFTYVSEIDADFIISLVRDEIKLLKEKRLINSAEIEHDEEFWAIREKIVKPYIGELADYLPLDINEFRRFFSPNGISYIRRDPDYDRRIDVDIWKDQLEVYDNMLYDEINQESNKVVHQYNLTLTPEIDSEHILDLITKRMENIEDGILGNSIIAKSLIEEYKESGLNIYFKQIMDGIKKDGMVIKKMDSYNFHDCIWIVRYKEEGSNWDDEISFGLMVWSDESGRELTVKNKYHMYQIYPMYYKEKQNMEFDYVLTNDLAQDTSFFKSKIDEMISALEKQVKDSKENRDIKKVILKNYIEEVHGALPYVVESPGDMYNRKLTTWVKMGADADCDCFEADIIYKRNEAWESDQYIALQFWEHNVRDTITIKHVSVNSQGDGKRLNNRTINYKLALTPEIDVDIIMDMLTQALNNYDWDKIKIEGKSTEEQRDKFNELVFPYIQEVVRCMPDIDGFSKDSKWYGREYEIWYNRTNSSNKAKYWDRICIRIWEDSGGLIKEDNVLIEYRWADTFMWQQKEYTYKLTVNPEEDAEYIASLAKNLIDEYEKLISSGETIKSELSIDEISYFRRDISDNYISEMKAYLPSKIDVWEINRSLSYIMYSKNGDDSRPENNINIGIWINQDGYEEQDKMMVYDDAGWHRKEYDYKLTFNAEEDAKFIEQMLVDMISKKKNWNPLQATLSEEALYVAETYGDEYLEEVRQKLPDTIGEYKLERVRFSSSLYYFKGMNLYMEEGNIRVFLWNGDDSEPGETDNQIMLKYSNENDDKKVVYDYKLTFNPEIDADFIVSIIEDTIKKISGKVESAEDDSDTIKEEWNLYAHPYLQQLSDSGLLVDEVETFVKLPEYKTDYAEIEYKSLDLNLNIVVYVWQNKKGGYQRDIINIVDIGNHQSSVVTPETQYDYHLTFVPEIDAEFINQAIKNKVKEINDRLDKIRNDAMAEM